MTDILSMLQGIRRSSRDERYERLAEAARKYASRLGHDDWCSKLDVWDPDDESRYCDCGFDRLIALLDEAKG